MSCSTCSCSFLAQGSLRQAKTGVGLGKMQLSAWCGSRINENAVALNGLGAARWHACPALSFQVLNCTARFSGIVNLSSTAGPSAISCKHEKMQTIKASLVDMCNEGRCTHQPISSSSSSHSTSTQGIHSSACRLCKHRVSNILGPQLPLAALFSKPLTLLTTLA
jgi:hypothetical protein